MTPTSVADGLLETPGLTEHVSMGGVRRVVIEDVTPAVDGGRFPVKRSVGQRVVVEADVFAEGHDDLAAVLLHRRAGQSAWRETPMRPFENDRWRGEFTANRIGCYAFTVEAWVDHFRSWTRDLRKRIDAGQDVSTELPAGAELVSAAAMRARGEDREHLLQMAAALTAEAAFSPELAALMGRYPDRRLATRHDREMPVSVDRERAAFSAWYEMFPRSAAAEPGRHGTFRDVEARLPYVAGMGFDVLYLPPIHPIGRRFRKGPNNSESSGPGDPGSPWAVGGAEGGHLAVHPELGTLDDFRHLLKEARRFGLEVAMDIAFQISPDHPWVREHPRWFRHRPDGSIRYAENPPKKYQDIYPIDFETEDWRSLWEELRGVFQHWIDQGVRIFRVDNPHTKPFAFWEWLIQSVKERHPDVIFLAEAFTRPKVMKRLAKLGFTQSYTYFAWRNEAWELKRFLTELVATEDREYYRPNFWPNTPDILTDAIQNGGRPTSALRFVLAATLAANYGIYGPTFELLDTAPLVPGREEYLNSEKYQVRHWDLNQPSLRLLITRVNRIRAAHQALQQDVTLRFLKTDNERLLAYSKTAPDGSDPMVMVVNLDSENPQEGWVEAPAIEVEGQPLYGVKDLLDGSSYRWRTDGWNYVRLDPSRAPAHILSLSRRLRPDSGL
jgi:starch synthase (maltosyl-transferring)